MRPTYTRLLAATFGLLLVTLPAQTAPDATAEAVAATAMARTMNEGLKFRSELVASITDGKETPAAALARLKSRKAPGGLDNIDPAADLGLAAIDIGHRLIAAGKPDEAEKFFAEAEKSLDQMVKRTPDSAARDKALFLRKLSFIRGRYLNKVAQAKADIEQAIALQPEDKGLQRVKDDLAKDNAEHFKDKPKG